MRFYSLLLSTLVALCSFTTGAQAEVDPSHLEGYVFAYFTGNSVDGEKIYLAASEGNDALNWVDLNGGKPVLSSTRGTRGLRDPFIIRAPSGDKFYVLATDLSIGSGTSWGDSVRTGSRYLEIWESPDLINWSEQRHVLVSPETAGNTWAPEAYWDEAIGQFVVFWASSLYGEDDPKHTGNSYHRVLSATTNDFVTFSEPKVWQDTGKARIDTTVQQVGDVYYRFTKDEASTSGCTDIIQESSQNLTAPVSGWQQIATCIGKNAGTAAIEGPTSFKSNPGDAQGSKYFLFVDEYGGRGYIPLETSDIAKPEWKVSASYKLPKSPRHGTVLPVTAAELGRVTEHYASSSSSSKRRSQSSHAILEPRSNPVLSGYYADPNIAVFGTEYYIYATTDGFEGWSGKEFYLWKSCDLVSWTRSKQPFLDLNGTVGNVPWANGNAWAPTIIEKDSKYYFYFSGNNKKSNIKTIGAAVADSPEGPFTAQAEAMILNTERVTSGQAIDPDAFFDPETFKYYLFWGNGKPLYAELNDDMVSVNWDSASEISGLTDFREGIFLNYRKGKYHLTYSIDDTGSENYRVGYATSSSIHGPWEYRGVILEKDASQGILATGHNSIINVPNTDDWYITYHRFHIPNGDGTHREISIDRLSFDQDTGFIMPVKPTLSGPDARIIPQ